MTTQPIRSDLWAKVAPAVDAILAFGNEQELQVSLAPRHDIPAFSMNAAGWPSVVERGFGGALAKTGPLNWTRLIGPDKNATAVIGPAQVPELQAYLVYVKADESLVERMSDLSGVPHGDAFRESWIDIEICAFLATIVDRVANLHLCDAESILQVYLAVEKPSWRTPSRLSSLCHSA